MSIVTIATIIFFLIYGINYFSPFRNAGVVLAVSALIIAIALLIGK
jgi:hypothetical protein